MKKKKQLSKYKMAKKKKRKFVKYVIFSLLAIIIIAVIVTKIRKSKQKDKIFISTEFAQKRTIAELITANGKIQPQTEVKISADVSGEIVELFIIEGKEVVKGDILLKINPDIYLSSMDKMNATLNSAKSNLANSKAYLEQVKARFTKTELSYNRNKSLYDQGAISKSEFEAITAEYAITKAEVNAAKQSVTGAKYNVRSAEASLKEARNNLNKTTIYAPVSGTISLLNVELGERVVGTIQMQGTEILRIANLNNMEVQVDVNENDIIRIKNGDTTIIEVDAYNNDKFIGIVSEIAHSANISGVGSDQVTNFEVKIVILKESYKHLIPKDDSLYFPFRPGMSATVDIKTESKQNVISVPIQAVTVRPDSVITKDSLIQKKSNINDDLLQEVVFVYQEDNTVEIKIVKTGIQDNQYIEITEGVDITDELVVAPYSAISKKLKDKIKVEKLKKEDLFK